MIKKLFSYFAHFVVAPGEGAERIAADPSGIWVAFWFTFLFATAYSITVLIYYLLGHTPVSKPILIVPLEKWYLVQAFTTIPIGFSAFLSYTGCAYLLCKAAGGKGSFDATFASQMYPLIIPCVVFMLSFELLVAPFLIAAGMSALPWPQWLEMMRVFILPFAWIFFMSTVALNRVHKIHWLACLGFIAISMIPAGGIMAVFIR